MKKTERRAATRNLETPGNSSFQSFPDSRISHNMNNLGISLGRDDNLVKSSTISIKKIEVDRLVVTAKKKLESKNNNKTKNSKLITHYSDDEDEEEEERLDAILSHVGGDINEELHEQGYDHILSDLSAV